jgi:hypothetical protein
VDITAVVSNAQQLVARQNRLKNSHAQQRIRRKADLPQDRVVRSADSGGGSPQQCISLRKVTIRQRSSAHCSVLVVAAARLEECLPVSMSQRRIIPLNSEEYSCRPSCEKHTEVARSGTSSESICFLQTMSHTHIHKEREREDLWPRSHTRTLQSWEAEAMRDLWHAISQTVLAWPSIENTTFASENMKRARRDK